MFTCWECWAVDAQPSDKAHPAHEHAHQPSPLARCVPVCARGPLRMAALWRRICSCWALWGTCVHLRCVVWFSLCALHVEHAYVCSTDNHTIVDCLRQDDMNCQIGFLKAR
jgi:hypothetical protein